MLFKRCDGRVIKTMDPYDKVLSYVMEERNDAMVFFEEHADCEILDKYIAEKKEQGIEVSYLDIIMAAIVRLYALRPQMNRFVMNGRFYAKNDISISIAIKKKLRDFETSTAVKLVYTGKEGLMDVKKSLDGEIFEVKKAETENGADKLAKFFMSLPPFIIKPVIHFVKWMDRHNIMPKAIIDFSPFHSSVFVTYMKSIGLGSVYHHIYNFGTVGTFVGVGKEQLMPVADQKTGEIKVKKMMSLRVVADERLCDGLYHARSMRLFRKLIANPRTLEKPIDKIEKDLD